jgi:hypothetical protein
MSYGFLLFLIAAAAILFFQARSHRARPSDLEAIEDYAKSRGMTVASIKQNNSYWRYWLRGRLLLSNLSRTFIVITNSPDGSRHEIHVAFDPWGSSKGLQVLEERQSLPTAVGLN